MSSTFSLILPFISLIIALVSIVLCLLCIWRTEKKLDIFMKLFTLAVVVIAVDKAVSIIFFEDNARHEYFSMATLFFLFLASLEMYRIITSIKSK